MSQHMFDDEDTRIVRTVPTAKTTAMIVGAAALAAFLLGIILHQAMCPAEPTPQPPPAPRMMGGAPSAGTPRAG